MLTNSKTKGQKLNKAFTLIELLAVIIILAVIALIATPIVLNVIENSRKESNKNSTYGILDAAKLYYTESMLDTTKTGVNGKTNLLDNIKITGKRPDSGTLYISDSGLVAIAVVYDDVCFKKEFNENDLTETTTDNCAVEAMAKFGGTIVAATEDDTHKGIVYMDPTDLKATCKVGDEIKVTDLTNKKGCMKFYIFDDSGDNYKIILDHNTSAEIYWINKTDYLEAGGTEEDWNAGKYNILGPITANKALSSDTKNWVGNPRLITSDEVAHIVGADKEDTIKWSSDKPISYSNLDTSINSSWYYLDGSGTTYSSSNGWQKPVANTTNISKYHWLYDNTRNCLNYGCKVEDNTKYRYRVGLDYYYYYSNGYWTSAAFDERSGGQVQPEGRLSGYSADSKYGIRPVLTLSKSKFE